MLSSLEVFRMASAMAQHAGTRQGVIASNMANADTPGYRARDVVPFADHYKGTAAATPRATRAGHLFGNQDLRAPDIRIAEGGAQNPNGNTVSLEDQVLLGVAVRKQHDRALAIYRSGLTILRAALGRG